MERVHMDNMITGHYLKPKRTERDTMNLDFYIPKKLEGISPIIWEQTSDSSLNWQMLPQGLISLTFNFEDPWTFHSERFTNKSSNPTEKFAFLCGLNTKPLKVSFPHIKTMGITLYPIAANLVFGIPCSELVDLAVNGEDILSHHMDRMENEIRELPDFSSRAVWLENFIYSIIQNNTDFSIAIKISKLLDQLIYRKINGYSADLYRLTGYSRMHTYRIFKDWFGLSPSQAVSIRQFNHTLENMHQEYDTLTKIALRNGYYDQAHFIRMFRQYAGMTPREYVKHKTHIVGQLPF
ncbi:helix-turn-helix domain-containing protein [Terrimonas rubra]|uniref:Helix-turn-helix domain-containing protein n=1 Tax=Terrimonas rubra TaxID=1035890 RepID=A0ABW6A0Q8_9BACT